MNVSEINFYRKYFILEYSCLVEELCQIIVFAALMFAYFQIGGPPRNLSIRTKK